jgi:hypothetical protein
MARARTGTIFSDAFSKFRGGTLLDDEPREGRKATSAVRARIAELEGQLAVLRWEDRALDGTTEIDAHALAQLAFERAHLGATWLAGVVRPNGAFYYIFRPAKEAYDEHAYNAIRHAGTTYALFQVYGAVRDEKILAAAEKVARYIRDAAVDAGHGRGKAYVHDGVMKLGGQALALVALLERRRATRNTTYDSLISDLAACMVAMEVKQEPGRYYQSVDPETRTLLLTPDSDYYPGECLLALTRLAAQFPDGPYLEAAKRAAAFLIHVRDGDIIERGAIPREDHWLAMALSELYRLDPDPDYATVAYLQAESMIRNQYTDADGIPARIGGSRSRNPINYTSTATKGEALVSAWSLAAFRQDQPAVERFAQAARRNAQFQMRVQYTRESTALFGTPERLIGAWAMDIANTYVRIDFVQHNISQLIGVWSMTYHGDLPFGGPIEA